MYDLRMMESNFLRYLKSEMFYGYENNGSQSPEHSENAVDYITATAELRQN